MDSFILEDGVLKKYKGEGGDVTIPAGVTRIGESAFSGYGSLTSVTFPEGVTNIDDYAFWGCRSLTDVTIPAGVTRIGNGAFSGCSGLTSVTIPEGVTSIGNGAFSGCGGLTSVTIPEGVTDIGEEAFQFCIGLTSVTIPVSVTSIGNFAFYGCSSLRSVTIPGSVETLGENAFDEKTSFVIEDISRLPAALRPKAAIGFAENGGNRGTPGFASHAKYIKGNAAKLVSLAMEYPALLALMCEEKLITPKNVQLYVEAAQKSGSAEAIAAMLDYQANKVSEKQKAAVEKRKEKEQDTVFDRLIARQGKEGIEGLSIAVTGRLETFENRNELKAFLAEKGAKLLPSLTSKVDYLILDYPESDSEKAQKANELGIEVITEGRFNDLAGRAFIIGGTVLIRYRGGGGDVTIPEGVTRVGTSAFDGCSSLTSVTIPEGVTSIGSCAFDGCSGLTSATIPGSVTSIGFWAFNACKNLTIRAPVGSFAERYAKDNRISFEACSGN